MSLLTSASRQSRRGEQAHFFMPERLHGESGSKARWLAWLLGLPLCAALGGATNYGWHLLHNEPVEQRVEVPHPTELPFKLLPQDYEFVTEPLPEADPVQDLVIDQPALPPVADKPVVPDAVDTDLRSSLEKRFMQAVNDTVQANTPAVPVQSTASPDATPLGALPPRISQQVPAMKYGAHVYSSIPANRTININGRDYHEGDEVVSGVVLLRIAPETSIFRVGSQSFSLNALTDWQGY